MNRVLLKFVWKNGQERLYLLSPTAETSEENLRGTVASIMALFASGDSLIHVDYEGRMFGIVGKDIISVEASAVDENYRI